MECWIVLLARADAVHCEPERVVVRLLQHGAVHTSLVRHYKPRVAQMVLQEVVHHQPSGVLRQYPPFRCAKELQSVVAVLVGTQVQRRGRPVCRLVQSRLLPLRPPASYVYVIVPLPCTVTTCGKFR